MELSKAERVQSRRKRVGLESHSDGGWLAHLRRRGLQVGKKSPNAAGLDLPCLLSHPVMNSINLNLFRASVGETTAFVVVSAVHSRTGCFTCWRPPVASRGLSTACQLCKTSTETAAVLIAHKC